jgi:hypothetical protein
MGFEELHGSIVHIVAENLLTLRLVVRTLVFDYAGNGICQRLVQLKNFANLA